MTAVRFPLDKLLLCYSALNEAQKRIEFPDPLWTDIAMAKAALLVYFNIPVEVEVQPPPAETFRDHLATTKDAA
jgi:hypothetical protein